MCFAVTQNHLPDNFMFSSISFDFPMRPMCKQHTKVLMSVACYTLSQSIPSQGSVTCDLPAQPVSLFAQQKDAIGALATPTPAYQFVLRQIDKQATSALPTATSCCWQKGRCPFASLIVARCYPLSVACRLYRLLFNSSQLYRLQRIIIRINIYR